MTKEYRHRNNNQRWFPTEVLELLELKKKDISWVQVAYILGRSVSACKNRYSMIRFTYMLRNDIQAVARLTITDRIKK